MRLDNAVKAGNFLQYVAQPALFTAASYYFHEYNKAWLSRSSIVTMLVFNSFAAHFFASKAIELTTEKVSNNRMYIPLGSTAFTILLYIKNSKLRVEGRYGEGIFCLVGLGVVYFFISLLINSIAQKIFRKGIENSLGEGIDLTENDKNEIARAWGVIAAEMQERRLPFQKIENLYDIKTTLSRLEITLFSNKTFAIARCPGLIFKKIIRRDFDEVVKHELVCKQLQLSELSIPQSRFIKINGMTFLVQKFDHHAAKQPHYYDNYAQRLEQAVLQLRTYILATGKANIEWQTMPVTENLNDGSLQIVLIDPKAARSILRDPIENTLGEGLDLTEEQHTEIKKAWAIVDSTIQNKITQINMLQPINRFDPYLMLKNLQPIGLQKRVQNLKAEDWSEMKQALAKQGIILFNNKVFAISQYPDLIFKKIGRKDFEVLITHQLVCKQQQLSELFIPQSRFIVISSMTFMVQKKLDYNAAKQPLYYLKYANRLEQAVLQLRTYIVETGEADVEWRNMPIIKLNGILRIALIDHESIEEPKWGIVGNDEYHRRGLIGLLCEEQARKVAMLCKQSSSDLDIDRALQKRLNELASWQPELERNQRFKEWAKKKNRKSNKKIEKIINLPQNLSANEIEGLQKTMSFYNENLERRNPREYASLYDLRTIEFTISIPKPMLRSNVSNSSTLLSATESTLSILKKSDNIFNYQLKEVVSYSLESVYNEMINVYLTA